MLTAVSKAQANLTAALKRLGFTVTNPSSLPTAFVASYSHGKGGRTMEFGAEYDALKDVGHSEPMMNPRRYLAHI